MIGFIQLMLGILVAFAILPLLAGRIGVWAYQLAKWISRAP